MSQQAADDFVDFYELLQVSSNAEAETIQRVFRLLAQRFHPDNNETGNEPMFQQLLKAYQVLSDPVQRASYDARYTAQVKLNWQIFDQATEPNSRQEEKRRREGILAVLYQKRRAEPSLPGMNIREMEGLINIPREHLEFPLWVLKERGDIRLGDNGRFMITVKGVEAYEELTAEASEDPDKIIHLLPAGKQQPA